MLPIFRKSVKLAPIAHFTLSAALLAFFMLAPSSRSTAFAQSATTGAIGGVVSDTGGALLPGVTITVTSGRHRRRAHGQEQRFRRVPRN